MNLYRSLISFNLVAAFFASTLCFASPQVDLLADSKLIVESAYKNKILQTVNLSSQTPPDLSEKQNSCILQLQNQEVNRTMQVLKPKISAFVKMNSNESNLISTVLKKPEIMQALTAAFNLQDLNAVLVNMDSSRLLSEDSAQSQNAEKAIMQAIDEYAKSKVTPLEKVFEKLNIKERSATEHFLNEIGFFTMDYELSNVSDIDSCLSINPLNQSHPNTTN